MKLPFLALLLSAATLSAAPITVFSYVISGAADGSSVYSQVSNGSLELSSSGSGGFNFSGNAVLFGAGQPITIGQEFDGPLELRFTDAVLSCTNTVTACSGSIEISADLFLSTTATVLPFFVGIEGTATGNPVGGSMGIIGDAFNRLNVRPLPGGPIQVIPLNVIGNITTPVVPINRVSAEGFDLSVMPSFAYSFTSPTAFPIASNITLAMEVYFNDIAPGTSISLPNSAWTALGDPSSAVPEPGTFLLLAAGMAGVYWFRRRAS
jgi:hypothetical protein